MPQQESELCELWSETRIIVPLYSRLYHLEPIGIATSMVESLTSYITRLADEHNVHPRVLLIREIAPLLRQSSLYRNDRFEYNYLTSLWKNSHTLNGTGTSTVDWVQALEKLTLQSDLRFLTMLPWSEVLPPTGLLRHNRAWCPECLEEWRQKNLTIYEPLLWSVEVVKICPRHRCQLQQRCPSSLCRKRQCSLGPRLLPGYCSACNCWLGLETQNEEEVAGQFNGEEWELLMWVSNTVGELLAVASSPLQVPDREVLTRNLRLCIESRKGNPSSIVERAHIHVASLWQWKKGRNIPELESLLRLCYHFGISPLALFTSDDVAPNENMPKNEFTLKQPRRQRRKFDHGRLKKALEEVLQGQEYSPPSVSEIARRLDYDTTTLWIKYPEECREISARYQEFRTARKLKRIEAGQNELLQIIHALHSEGLSPSEGRVKKLLKRPGIFRDPELNKLWRETFQALGQERG